MSKQAETLTVANIYGKCPPLLTIPVTIQHPLVTAFSTSTFSTRQTLHWEMTLPIDEQMPKKSFQRHKLRGQSRAPPISENAQNWKRLSPGRAFHGINFWYRKQFENSRQVWSGLLEVQRRPHRRPSDMISMTRIAPACLSGCTMPPSENSDGQQQEHTGIDEARVNTKNTG